VALQNGYVSMKIIVQWQFVDNVSCPIWIDCPHSKSPNFPFPSSSSSSFFRQEADLLQGIRWRVKWEMSHGFSHSWSSCSFGSHNHSVSSPGSVSGSVGGIPHLLHIGITHLLQNTQNTIKLNHAQHSTTNPKPHHPNNK